MKRVLLAMSGGVDSSVAALLLREQGYDVVGCTMQLWNVQRNPPMDGMPRIGRCCSLDDAYDARRVAEALGFPFYVLNFEKEFEQFVIDPFIGEYLSGKTPIPCTLCNTYLKFDRLASFAERVGIETIASGHYARTVKGSDDEFQLLAGSDSDKDQSYYLFELTQSQLSRIVFPIGEYRKKQIREIAKKEGLVTAEKAESQEICFVPDGDYAAFIRRNASQINDEFLPILDALGESGPIKHIDGTALGTHQGIYHYTVGQRRGLGIAHRRPLYVTELDALNNTVYVGYKEDVHSHELTANRVNWISSRLPEGPIEVCVRVRSNHKPAPARLQLEHWREGDNGRLSAQIVFEEPQLAITPGQAAVFYHGNRVLGGGWIGEKVV